MSLDSWLGRQEVDAEQQSALPDGWRAGWLHDRMGVAIRRVILLPPFLVPIAPETDMS